MTSPYWTVWLDEALRLEEENRELRRLVGALLAELARSHALAVYAHEYVDARFPDRKEGRRAA